MPAPDRPARAPGFAALPGVIVSTALVAALAADVPASIVAPLHVLATLVCAALVARATGDRAAAVLVGLATLVLGPVGALAAMGALAYAGRREGDPSLAAWHERLIDRRDVDPAEALYRDITEGRAFRPNAVPATFVDVMAGGDVALRQRLLGMLAQKRGDVPQALLDAGLAAPELAVRAPAAAVVARLRELERDPRI